MKRYKLTNDKTLVDTREDKTYVFEKVRAERKGRITSAIFKLHDGSDFKMALHSIDMNGHDLGFGKAKATTARTTPPPASVLPAPVPPINSICMTRDELLQIHGALQSAADVTLKRLVESLR